MTKLILSPTISRRLREIAATNSQHDALQSLRAALADQPLQQAEKMTAQSPAVPAPSAEKQEQAVVLEHTLLISIASWASTQLGADGNGGDDGAFKLSALVRGSRVHVPPKPVFLRSKELEQSLAAIRKAQEQAEYSRMSSSTTHTTGAYKIPSSYTNIAGVDPTLPLAQRFASSTPTSLDPASRKAMAENEEQAWRDAQRQLSVMLNIFLSALATATAAWWASGNASPARKVLVSMFVALVTALAEIVLYNRYHIYVSQSKKIKATRLKGSDVKSNLPPSFAPLQLDTLQPSKESRQLQKRDKSAQPT
ncbi:hypothetical protein PANT_16d00039 [Moesziomyces antarcticus T-34]|uniref:Endoplasmic reticulum-based factor for assembly of V-ATPase n=1 Tax=Pseudozyma antarctica (strain T-34) TaxID=1151754 RepID=M9LY34_PSEA3|nr:hypothetical protein PANT_16d00039 [Moesziomyces antarcticus T-34]